MDLSKLEIEEVTLENADKAKKFCLAAIKEIYDIDYNKVWHHDLDDLKNKDGVYYKGGLLLLVKYNGETIACGGLRSINSRPDIKKRFNLSEKTGSIWRVYVLPKYHYRGVGKIIYSYLEKKAKEFGYTNLYLHTSLQFEYSIPFWKKRGYKVFFEEPFENPAFKGDKVIHMIN